MVTLDEAQFHWFRTIVMVSGEMWFNYRLIIIVIVADNEDYYGWYGWSLWWFVVTIQLLRRSWLMADGWWLILRLIIMMSGGYHSLVFISNSFCCRAVCQIHRAYPHWLIITLPLRTKYFFQNEPLLTKLVIDSPLLTWLMVMMITDQPLTFFCAINHHH